MRQVFKQTSWLILAQVLTKVIGFFYTIFLAKSLGVADFGLFSVGLAYFSMISAISDFGFNRYLIREISKEEGQKWELVCNLLMLRLTIVSLFFGIFSLILYSFDQDKMRVSVILLSSLAILPQTVGLTFDGVFVALRRLQFSAVAAVISSLATVLIGVFLLSHGFAVYGATNALILGQLIFALTFLLLFGLHIGIKLSEVKLSLIKKALAGSLPYGILGILGLLYFKIDAIILSYLRGNFETGIYAAAYKLLEASVFVPAAISTAIFPVMARSSKETVKKLYFKSISLMFYLSLVFLLGFILILPLVIKTFLPVYLPSVEVIKILSLAVPFIFVHVAASQVLLSGEKYLKKLIILSILPLSLNILLNLIFIPQYGYLAAAWITVVSDIFSFAILYYFLKKYFLND